MHEYTKTQNLMLMQFVKSNTLPDPDIYMYKSISVFKKYRQMSILVLQALQAE